MWPHSHWVWRVAFSPDSRTLATATSNGVISLYDVASGAQLRSWSGHAGGASAVTFSQNGKLLATAGDDRTAKVWDMQAGEIQGTLLHTAAVNGVAFSPDGKSLATAGADRMVHVFPLQVDELIALARTRVTRALSVEECGI